MQRGSKIRLIKQFKPRVGLAVSEFACSVRIYARSIINRKKKPRILGGNQPHWCTAEIDVGMATDFDRGYGREEEENKINIRKFEREREREGDVGKPR